MKRNRKWIAFLLAGCLALTACSQKEPKPTVPSRTDDGIISKTPGDREALVFQGGDIVPTPTYQNGTVYEPFGLDTTFTDPHENAIWSFKLPDEEIFTDQQNETYRAIDYNNGLGIYYGYLDNLRDDNRNQEQLQDTAVEIISAYQLAPAFEIKEEATYKSEVHSFQTIVGLASYEINDQRKERWTHIMGIPISDETYLYWIVQEPGRKYGEYLQVCENIMLSFQKEAP